MTGRIALTCAQRDGRSYLSHIRYDGLSRVSRPQRAGGAAHLMLAHLGPGVIGGDRYALDVEVQAGASLLLTGQMATPVYARTAASSLDAAWQVETGASLIMCGEPVMLDAGARHEMCTTIDVAGDGYALARVRTIARIDGRVVARDACDFRAFAGAIATITIVCADAARREAIAASLAPLAAAARGGLGATPGAVILRAANDRVWPLQTLVNAVKSRLLVMVESRDRLDGVS